MKSKATTTLLVGLSLCGGVAAVSFLYPELALMMDGPTVSQKNGVGTANRETADMAIVDQDTIRKSEGARLDASQAVINNQLSTLNLEVDSLRNQIALLSENAEDSLLSTEESTEEPVSDPEREEQLRAEVYEQLTLFDDVALNEGIDNQWALSAEEDLSDSFGTLEQEGISASEVQCHSSFCQVQLSLEGDATVAMQKMQGISSWGGESVIWIEDVEEGNGVMFVAREGHQLPVLDQQG